METQKDPSDPFGRKKQFFAVIFLSVFVAVLLFACIFQVSEFYVGSVAIVAFLFVLRIVNGEMKRVQIDATTFFYTISFLLCAFCLAAFDHALYEHEHGFPNLPLIIQQTRIVKALHAYHDQHGRLPPAVVFGPKGEALYSWRVLILPYLGQEELYKKFRLSEPWDSPENSKLLREIPQEFRPDWLDMTDSPYSTFHQVVVGPGAAFEGERGLNLEKDFPDGTEQTIILVEAWEPVPWTSPQDISFDPRGEIPPFGRPRKSHLGRIAWNGGRVFPSYFCAAMANGGVLVLANSPDRNYLRAWITRNGGDKAED